MKIVPKLKFLSCWSEKEKISLETNKATLLRKFETDITRTNARRDGEFYLRGRTIPNGFTFLLMAAGSWGRGRKAQRGSLRSLLRTNLRSLTIFSTWSNQNALFRINSLPQPAKTWNNHWFMWRLGDSC